MRHQIVFLGAGFRTTMAQIFLDELESHPNLACDISSVESLSSVKPPIGDYMSILNGPRFDSSDFPVFLSQTIDGFEKTLFIPFMDSACRALSQWGQDKNNFSGFLGSPDSHALTDKYYLQSNLPLWGISTPQFSGLSEYVIVKPRFGFGSRGIQKLKTSFYNNKKLEWDSSWVVQDFITGPEISVDIYVSKTNEYSAVSRERIRISDGEVLETRTRNLDDFERSLIEILISRLNIRGPINIQLIGEERKLLEINPRFSGGCTASIAAGWNSPKWLVSEYLLDQKAPLHENFSHVHVIRSRRDHVRRLS